VIDYDEFIAFGFDIGATVRFRVSMGVYRQVLIECVFVPEFDHQKLL
jgi:hypothetical protein